MKEDKGAHDMIGVVDVGGGNRDAFGAGIFDYCMDNNINFDICIGVSAGSANCVSYISGQRGRNLRFYTRHNISKESISLKNMIFKHSLVDLDHIYVTISNHDGIDPFDYEAFRDSRKQMITVATSAETGRPVYFEKSQMQQDDYRILSASCNLPVINSAYEYEGACYYDGGYSDPIPFAKAFEMGCSKVVVILTLPKTHMRSREGRDERLSHLMLRYPKIRTDLVNKAELYNRQLHEALQLEKKGSLLILAPENEPEISTLEKDAKKIEKIYREGYLAAASLSDFFTGSLCS